MTEDTKFKVGDWVTPNPDFLPSGACDGRLTIGQGYCVLEVQKSRPPLSDREHYKVQCNNGEICTWLGKCWAPFDPVRIERMHPEESLEEIHQSQEAYKEITNGHK